MPDFDPEHDMRFVRDSDGELVGAAWMSSRSPFIETYGRGFVSPEHVGQGIGTFLIEWQLSEARRRVGLAEDGLRVVAKIGLDPGHVRSMSLVSAQGLSPERYFLEMRIEFDGKRSTPRPLPGGIEFIDFDPETDLERLLEAVDEAFRDHYGYVERPLDDEVERFRRFMEQPSFDPSLVWIAADGDQIVGSNICIGEHEEDPTVGYVANIAVRRPWRGRGLAKTMLEVAFDEFARRGKTAAALHVDADSLTDATRLYESVGMREVFRTAVFELELRPGKDLVVS